MSTSSRRRQPKSPALPIDLEEIEQDPGFRGMLSFLEVSPEDRAALLAQRAVAEAQSPMGDTPSDQPLAGQNAAPTTQLPLGQPPIDRQPRGQLPDGEAKSLVDLPPGDQPEAESPAGHQPGGYSPGSVEQPPGLPPAGEQPVADLPTGLRRFVPYMEVEGRGKRPLRFCNTAQDGHTAGEQIVYQTLSNYARKFGRPEPSGSTLLDIGLSQLCSLLGADHKNVKRLIGSLQEKLAIEIVRQPDYRLAIPTRYRIFNSSQVLERRRAAGLQWVIRTRAVRFVDLATVNRLLAEQSVGEIPMDDPTVGGGLPMGATPGPDAGSAAGFSRGARPQFARVSAARRRSRPADLGSMPPRISGLHRGRGALVLPF